MICNIYLQAESDSRKRKESVDKVCKTLDVTNILEPSTDKTTKKSRLQRFNPVSSCDSERETQSFVLFYTKSRLLEYEENIPGNGRFVSKC